MGNSNSTPQAGAGTVMPSNDLPRTDAVNKTGMPRNGSSDSLDGEEAVKQWEFVERGLIKDYAPEEDEKDLTASIATVSDDKAEVPPVLPSAINTVSNPAVQVVSAVESKHESKSVSDEANVSDKAVEDAATCCGISLRGIFARRKNTVSKKADNAAEMSESASSHQSARKN